MNRRLNRPAVRTIVAALMTAAWLVGCGGGGGGGGSGGGGDDTTGLVPDPPALGETLQANASTLRPMVAGATWQYAGTAPGNVGYVNSVSQAAAPTGVTESSTNVLNEGAQDVHIAVVSGNVVEPDAIDVDGDGHVDLTNAIEIRSPVQVGDQFVLFDQRIPNALPDADGDGRGESLDLAMYGRVIGAEDVALTGLPTQHAVRIDQVVAARVVLTKDGQALPAATATQSVWYAAGLGVVRRRLDAPNANGVDRDITDERLTGWSGLP